MLIYFAYLCFDFIIICIHLFLLVSVHLCHSLCPLLLVCTCVSVSVFLCALCLPCVRLGSALCAPCVCLESF